MVLQIKGKVCKEAAFLNQNKRVEQRWARWPCPCECVLVCPQVRKTVRGAAGRRLRGQLQRMKR